LALALSRHVFHSRVRDCMNHLKSADRLVFCRATQQSFLRLLTTSAVTAPYGLPSLSNKAAWSVYEGFLGSDQIRWADEPQDLETHWKKLAARPAASPKLWMDAYLAAFAIAGDFQLVTTDQAFKQFKGLALELVS